MNKLLEMKECLIHAVESQLHNLDSANCEELGGAIDMIKDLAEAAYYCTITEAMEEKYDKGGDTYYYTEYRYPERDMDRDYGRMYYSDSSSSGNYMGGNSMGGRQGSNSSKNFQEHPWSMETMRDSREGRSPVSRKSYIESKEMHKDKATQTMELEKYMTELSKDLTEIIEDATPEEKAILQKKLSALSSKIV